MSLPVGTLSSVHTYMRTSLKGTEIPSKTKYKSKTTEPILKVSEKMQNSFIEKNDTSQHLPFETQYPKVQIISNDLTATKSTYTKFLNSALNITIS